MKKTPKKAAKRVKKLVDLTTTDLGRLRIASYETNPKVLRFCVKSLREQEDTNKLLTRLVLAAESLAKTAKDNLKMQH